MTIARVNRGARYERSEVYLKTESGLKRNGDPAFSLDRNLNAGINNTANARAQDLNRVAHGGLVTNRDELRALQTLDLETSATTGPLQRACQKRETFFLFFLPLKSASQIPCS